jgi:hypothetical protein
MEPLLTEAEAAAKLGMKPEGLRGLRKDNRGPAFSRIGRLIRYFPDEVERWARSQGQATDKEVAA